MDIEKLELSALLADGFTERFAVEFLDAMEAEKNNPALDQDYVMWAHSNGFLAESAYLYGLNDSNVNDYLSDYENRRIWPVNSWSRIWVNDKLTLKLMLEDSTFNNLMPEYYYYAAGSSDGVRLKTLSDARKRGGDKERNFIDLLREIGEFACKPNNGSRSVGFAKISFKDDTYFINDSAVTENELLTFVRSNANMLYTEYLKPSAEFARYSPLIHTIRIVIANPDGDDPNMIHGYIRIPHSGNGEANYTVLTNEKMDMYNLFLDINFETGEYGNAVKAYFAKTERVFHHPDSNAEMKGTIPNWENLKEELLKIARKFSNLEYIGFDIGISEKGPKCMEINTDPGIQYSQLYRPLMATQPSASFFRAKIEQMNKLTEEERKKRNKVRN